MVKGGCNKKTLRPVDHNKVLPRRVPRYRAIVIVFGSPRTNLVNQSRIGAFKCTHDVSTTVGIIPSIVFSSFGSAPEMSQMIIFPSQPQVA